MKWPVLSHDDSLANILKPLGQPNMFWNFQNQEPKSIFSLHKLIYLGTYYGNRMLTNILHEQGLKQQQNKHCLW